MVDFQTMTKTDTLTEGTDQLRVAFPLDGEGIAAAIAGADHAQKKLVSARGSTVKTHLNLASS